jgi:8-oxo-dGTP diphosphatase
LVDRSAEPVLLLPVVAIALVDPAGRVLIARRRADGPHGGLWEFPGGKIEPGERPEAALVREAREELGVEVAESELQPVGFASEPLGTRHLVLLLYCTDRWNGDPMPHDADALDWAAVEDLAPLAMPPADRALIPLLTAAIVTNRDTGR